MKLIVFIAGVLVGWFLADLAAAFREADEALGGSS